jgi:tetratricopeptide (TPR) repeat protein
MLRFGKEAYQRGKYLDAKQYFRKAVKADPTSPVAWRYYDQAVIFALAEKVEKDATLTFPDVSERQELSTRALPSVPPPPSKPAPTQEDTEFKIVEDEGC